MEYFCLVFHVFMGTPNFSTFWDTCIMKTQTIKNLICCLNYSYFSYLISVIVFCKAKFFWLFPVTIGVGSACHLGVLLDVPCLGVAKNLFFIENDIDRNEEHMEQVLYFISHFRWCMYNIFSNTLKKNTLWMYPVHILQMYVLGWRQYIHEL